MTDASQEQATDQVTQQPPASPYELLGEQGIRDLVNHFYDAMDELPVARRIRAMHAEKLDSVRRMLTAYLVTWMGGPPVYLAIKGTMCLTDPHAPYAIGPQERDAWLACMDEALERLGAAPEIRTLLKEPFFRVADTVRNRDNSETRAQDPNIIAVG